MDREDQIKNAFSPLPLIGRRQDASSRSSDAGERRVQKPPTVVYLRALSKHRWKILIFVVLVTLVAAVWALSTAPIYRSTATLLIEYTKPKILSNDTFSSDSAQELGHFQTQLELITSRDIEERTVRSLHLWDSLEFKEPGSAGLLGRVKSWFGSNSSPPRTTEKQIDALMLPFSAAVRVEAVGLSQLIKVSFDSRNPALAAQVANELASQYIQADHDARLAASQRISAYLEERLASLRTKLTASEEALQLYRDSRGIVSLSGSAQTVANQQLGGTNESLVKARSRRTELESTYGQVSAARGGDYSDVPAIMRYPGVAEASRQVNDARGRLAALSQSLGPNHTRILQAQAELSQLERTLKLERAAAVAGVKQDYEAARDTELSLERALGSARKSAQDVNREEFQLGSLERDVATNRQLYDLFLNRWKESSLAAEVQAPVARIADPAKEARFPIRPAKLQIVAIAALLSFALGSLAAVLRGHFDSSMRDVGEAESRLGLPVLTALPQVARSQRPQLSRSALDFPYSPHAEAIRTARTELVLTDATTETKILLVTSALPGEGKTTFACNLALSHAQTQRTLLVDADMRRSKLSQRLGLPADLPGLTNLVSGGLSIRDAAQVVSGSPLLFMPVGNALPANPLDLMLSEPFRATLKALAGEFEVIIIDSPPVESVSDALALAPLMTHTLVVIRAMSTQTSDVRRTLARLRRGGAVSVSAILNSVEMRKDDPYSEGYGNNLPSADGASGVDRLKA